MVTQNFQWAAKDERSFDERFFKDIRLRHSDIVNSMENNWDLSREQLERLTNYSLSNPDNHLSVCLHIMVYADDDNQFKDVAREKVSQFMDTLYQQEDNNDTIEYYEDGISSFLTKNKSELKWFTQFANSWALTPTLIDHAFKRDDGNKGGNMLLLGYDPK